MRGPRVTRALDMLREFQVEARRRADLAHRLDELATLWRNLGIAGALCAAYGTGWSAAHRCDGARQWRPGCGRSAV